MGKVIDIRTVADVEAMLAASAQRPLALLKHSNACPVSSRGNREFLKLEEDGGLPIYRLVVQYAREASDLLEERLGVQHETPQAHIVHAGVSVFVQNHRAISADALQHASETMSG